jgi:hypothetical protein
MRRLTVRKTASALLLLALLSSTFTAVPTQAQAIRTWVSGVGDDANTCSRTAPCKTFGGTISKTALNGEINCLDPGGFGAVTITKSITIDCHEIVGSIIAASTNAINIPFDSFTAAGETRKTVRIRNLNINGADTGLNGIRITGAASAGSAVFIEDTVIDGFFGAPGRGISDERSGGGELSISNTTVRNTGATGIVLVPASGATRLDATLDNVRVQNGNFGIAVSGGARVIINRSVFSGNTQGGIYGDSATDIQVSNSVTSNNGVGVWNGGGAVTIRLSDSDVVFNGTAFNGPAQSFRNNRIVGNGSIGTAPSQIGVTSEPTGLQ